jgi:hypothetical protein
VISLHKYPRTQHLHGSRLQPGDEDLDAVPLEALAGRYVVIEEKLDGANAGLSFDDTGKLWLQSRGHFLTGGTREKHWDLFKQWAHIHAYPLHDALGDAYVLFGEWLYARHTIFYDTLPAYFMEFDLLERATGEFLSTARRREVLAALPIQAVPVLFEGHCHDPREIPKWIERSRFKSNDWRTRLEQHATERGLDIEQLWRETDASDLMEGLYVKVEENGVVAARYKYIRASFLTTVFDSGTHWLRRPIVPNLLG